MSLLGIGGMATGYLVGGGSNDPQAMVPALYGLVGGCVAGVAVRIVLRRRYMAQRRDENQKDG